MDLARVHLPAARWGAASAGFEGKLWLMGGYIPAEDEDDDSDGEIQEETDSVLVYDSTVDLWTQGPPLPNAAAGACIATVRDGELWVMGPGGAYVYRGPRGVEESPWEECPRVWRTRSGATCASILLG